MSSINYKTTSRLLLYALKEGRQIHPLNTALLTAKSLLNKNPKHYDNIVSKLYLGLNEDEWVNKITQQLETYPVRTCKIINSYVNLNEDMLEDLCYDKFNTYSSFAVFGCPSSTDIDVIVVVDKHSNGNPYPLFSRETNRLRTELSELGYDITHRDLDINLISIENKMIVASDKGGVETQNMILSTYHYHNQKYECPDLQMVKVDIGDRLRAFSKYVLNNLEYVVEDYSSLRDEKKKIYMDGVEAIMVYVKDINHIFIEKSENKKWKDAMKAMVMKYTQMILIENDIYSYIKDDIIKQFGTMYPHLADSTEWFLYRGKRGEFSSELIPILHSEYCRILDTYLTRFNYNDTTVLKDNIHNPTKLSDELFREFLKNPVNHTERFQELWKRDYGDMSVNEIFPIVSSSAEDIVPIIGDNLAQQFVFIDQRSQEWLELLNFYECGKNSKNIKDTFEAKYNLIRGAITELIIMDQFNASTLGNKFTKCSVGFIVENARVRGSNGCAPDLLAVSSDEIIPIEIKTLKSSAINSDYYRGISLASKQCTGVKDILQINESAITINKGLMLMAYFTDTSLVIRSLLIDI